MAQFWQNALFLDPLQFKVAMEIAFEQNTDGRALAFSRHGPTTTLCSMPSPRCSSRILPALALLASAVYAAPARAAVTVQVGEMAGYLLVPNDKVPETFNAGFSLYVAAWPLLKDYPGSRFQTGLFGTWMFAQYEGKGPTNLYSDVEGGLGWWRDTRFATETPKFIMGGVAPNFVEWANGPGAGKGRDWKNPSGKYGVAQLSPWVLWPPDGLNLKQGTCGQ